MRKLLLIPLALIVLVLVPFVLWGEHLEAILTIDAAQEQFGATGLHGGLTGILLIVADVFLPIPRSAVMSGLGILYGPVMGTVYALIGSLIASTLAYGIGRWLGRPLVQRWMGAELDRGEALFAKHGGWIVAISRWLPVLAEVIPVVAGVNRMSLPVFLLAVLVGALPNCAVFATLGHLGADEPVLTVIISAFIPIALWLLAVWTGLTRRLGITHSA
ncbi:MAG: VTT domain-containing protein [Pseudomonadota bacterium]